MSKNNRNRAQQGATVQAADTQKTAVDAKEGLANAAVTGVSTGASTIEGSNKKDPSDTNAGASEAERLRAEREQAERDAAELERLEDAKRAEQARLAEESRLAAEREKAERDAAECDEVEVRVLRDGYFGSINEVATIPRSIVAAAEADGAVCSNPASVAEAKSLAKDD